LPVERLQLGGLILWVRCWRCGDCRVELIARQVSKAARHDDRSEIRCNVQPHDALQSQGSSLPP